MLTIWDRQEYSHCDRVSRRNFLKIGALGGLTMADLLRLRAQGADAPRSPGQKAVIMVYLPGGPSHIDTYDPKPEAPPEIRGEYGAIQTNVPGIRICDKLPLHAKIADKLAIVRSVKFAGTHECHELVTGVSFRERVKRPAFGSIVSRLKGAPGALPHYVSLGYWTVGGGKENEPELPQYSGAAHRPFRPGGTGLENLALPGGLTLDRMTDRRGLMQSMDNLRREMEDRNGTLAGVDRFTTQALEMILSPKAREAFDIGKEAPRTKEKYGRAEVLLLARRLVEAGVSVVTVPLPGGSWDMHAAIYEGMPAHLNILDPAIYALVTDLHERGMDKDVAVVVWGEFGREPRLTVDAGAAARGRTAVGRNHWPEVGFALLAGGGLKVGQVIGETDARGERSRNNPYMPSNVLATLYHVLGIDPATKIPNHNGRPTYLLDDREPIAPLL